MEDIHMKTIKTILLTGAACLAALTSIGSANAQNIINGGGASLPSPTWRQAANCHGADTIQLQIRPNTTALQTIPGSTHPGCVVGAAGQEPTTDINYVSTGSGRGVSGVFSNTTTPWSSYLGTQHSTVQYGISETAINAGNVAYYNTGTLPAGVTYAGDASGVPAAGGTKAIAGPLIQIPLLIAPVTIAFDPQYTDGNGVARTLNIVTSNARKPSGGLKLDQAAYCALFGAAAVPITNLNDPRLTALNSLTGTGGVSLQNPADTTTFNVPIEIVGRSDSSGTTSLWTRHLSAVCGTVPYANNSSRLPGGSSTAPFFTTGSTIEAYYDKSTNAVTGTVTPGKYTIAEGSDGVAKRLNYVAGQTVFRIGYLGPDWVLPAAATSTSVATNYGLKTADVKNKSGKFVAPTTAGAAASFGAVVPPANAAKSSPDNWVAAPDRTAPQANPTALAGYPIIGTSNFLTYTCFDNTTAAGKRTAMAKYLKWYYTNAATNAATGVLAKAGFAALPAAWKTAIRTTFFDTTAPLEALKLYFVKGGATDTGFTAANPICTVGGTGVLSSGTGVQ